MVAKTTKMATLGLRIPRDPINTVTVQRIAALMLVVPGVEIAVLICKTHRLATSHVLRLPKQVVAWGLRHSLAAHRGRTAPSRRVGSRRGKAGGVSTVEVEAEAVSHDCQVPMGLDVLCELVGELEEITIQ